MRSDDDCPHDDLWNANLSADALVQMQEGYVVVTADCEDCGRRVTFTYEESSARTQT